MTLLAIQHVSKIYSAQEKPVIALKDVTLSVYKGEIVSLLGVNGAGKSTLSSIIAALHPPTAGDITYLGSSIYNDIPAYKAAVGFCPQHPNLNIQLTVEQNLYFAGLAYRLSAAEARERAHELITTFDLLPYKDKKPGTLSGGYKQRVVLARTLMHKPSLILLDEPTVGLDPQVRYDLWSLIRSLRDAGTSIILTTHYIEEAERLSDRVCVLDQGVIRLIGTPDALKAAYAKNSLESVFLELTKIKNS